MWENKAPMNFLVSQQHFCTKSIHARLTYGASKLSVFSAQPVLHENIQERMECTAMQTAVSQASEYVHKSATNSNSLPSSSSSYSCMCIPCHNCTFVSAAHLITLWHSPFAFQPKACHGLYIYQPWCQLFLLESRLTGRYTESQMQTDNYTYACQYG